MSPRAAPVQPAPDLDAVIARAMRTWRPPPRLSLSEWADQEFVLSPESSAEPGRWTCIPYQRGILDAFSDPEIERVSVMKSARIGWTKILNVVTAYYAAHDPCPILIVQPTVEDARGYSIEELRPMIRDVPALAAIMPDPEIREVGQTVLHKTFPGGIISLVGATSGRGFRRVSRKVVLFDEVDGYPPAAGDEGDQIKLGVRRTEFYWDRKIGAGSTPLLAGLSRIEAMFEAGDQRRYHVPCPQCSHMAPLVFRGENGHTMKWPEGKPEAAFFVCQAQGCVIEHASKREMIERGRWIAAKPGGRHASFHVWAAYSYSPNATWGQIATEFLEATRGGPEELKTFVNTVLGETWHERGEAPDWQRLYDLREPYLRGTIPAGALLLTAGVDVQRDRLVWEIVGWGADRQSWSIDAGVFPGDPAAGAVWQNVDDLLAHEWPTTAGGALRLSMLAVDSSDQTSVVYGWARRHPMNRVIATKGVSTARTLVSSPSAVDVTVNGRRLARGYKVWPIGVDIAKGELYGWLRLDRPTVESGLPFPPGFCHFPEYGEDFFKQLTGEHLVKVVKRTGHVHYEWQMIPGRENHYLDCRVLARAAAALVGLDRRARIPAPPPADAGAAPVAATPAPAPAAPAPAPAPVVAAPRPPARPRSGGGWLGGRGRGWLSRNR